ncbi:MAG: tetratricopeptide repeat protein [Candidatus Aminicenantaceae bacterium]
MVKKIWLPATLLMLLLWSCVTYQPPSPNLYIENLPAAEVSSLSLDERLIAEDAWRNIKQGNADKAIKQITKLDQDNPFYYTGLGYAYYVLNDITRAENYFKAASTAYPELALAHLGLGQIYQETGRDDMAFTEYREVLKHDPNHPWARARYETIQQRKTQEAMESGRSSFSDGDNEAAKTSFLRALYYTPQSNEAHRALAEIYTSEGQYESAIIHFKAAVTNEPESQELLAAYADTLYQSGDNSRSMEVYEQLIVMDPGNETAQQRIEVLKNRLGIFELPSQYHSIPSTESVTKEQMSALIGVKFKDVLEKPDLRPPIIIDISTSWASRYILDVASLGLLDVYPNHTFQPQKIITRAEMAETLHRLIRRLEQQGYRFIQQIPPERIQIEDVSSDNFYYRPIVMMISYDLMTMQGGRRFNPDQPASGADAMQHLDLILTLIK